MSTSIPPDRELRSWYAGELVPLALAGLERMVAPGGDCFCHRARPAPGGGLVLEGESERYSAMVLIGLAARGGAGRKIPQDRVRDRLVRWALEQAGPGDAGLVLWALVLARDARADQVGTALVGREGEVLGPGAGFTTMEMGWLLAGLSEALAAGVAAGGLEELAAGVYENMLRCQREPAGLFSFGLDQRRRNVHAARVDARLGSFANQVYPVIGLARYGRATRRAAARAAARRCTEALCRLQGPDGQWWWIYHAPTGRPVLRYPVYSVHQDAMGPLALLAGGEGGEPHQAALRRGLRWLAAPPEMPGADLIDQERGAIWRALQRDEPARTGKLGLGRGERLRLHLAAWTGRADRRPLRVPHLCPECRPYHLGWILLTAAWLKDKK